MKTSKSRSIGYHGSTKPLGDFATGLHRRSVDTLRRGIASSRPSFVMRFSPPGLVSLALLLVLTGNAHSEVSPFLNVYRGLLGEYPIEFVVNWINADSQAIDGVYMYEKYNDPIELAGVYLSKNLTLNEKGGNQFILGNFEEGADSINGFWLNGKTKKRLPVQLIKQTDYLGILQKKSLKDFFFRVGKSPDAFYRVEVYEKKGGRLLQEVLGGSYFSLEMVAISEKDRKRNEFYIANNSNILFGYKILAPNKKIKRLWLANSEQDSLDILHFLHGAQPALDEYNDSGRTE